MDLEAAPLYQFLLDKNTRVLGNIIAPQMVGHIIWEFDNFLRMRHLGEIDDRYRYMAILSGGALPAGIAEVLPRLFKMTTRKIPQDHVRGHDSPVLILVDDEMRRRADRVQHFRPDFFVDVGVMGIKVGLPNEAHRHRAGLVLTEPYKNIYWTVSHDLFLADMMQYFRRRAESRNYCPWTDIPELGPDLEKLVGNRADKLALVHIRYQREANNAGTITDPSALIPTLAYLRDTGHTIIKIGTEPCPAEFAPFSVVNYSESALRSFANDLRLFKAAKFCMINASGVENIADLLGTPMVSYGRWHLRISPPGRNSVIVPSLFRSRANGRLLKFSEQILHFKNLPEPWEKNGVMNFPKDEFEERSPLGDELLAGAREAIELGANFTPRTPQQEQYATLDRRAFRHLESRISQYFLDRFPEALSPGFVEHAR